MATNEHNKKETQERSNDEDGKKNRQEWGGWQRANLENHLPADGEVIDELENQQTKDEIIEELKNKLEKANRTNDELWQKINELCQKINELECALQRETEKSKDILQNSQEENIQLRNKTEKLEKDLNYYKGLCNSLEDGKKTLIKTIEQFQDEHLQFLQCTGKLCAHNCVLCTILWTCQWKLRLFPCGLQLLILLYHEVAAEIKNEDRICHKLIMEIFIKWEIVAVAAEGEYPTEENAKLEKKKKAWETIMTMDDSKHVLILGRIAESRAIGHADICDLDSRTSKAVDGTVRIYNPQKNENANELNEEQFIDLVKNDRGLIIYLVHLGRLNQICTDNAFILHYTNQADLFTFNDCVAMEH